MPYLPQGLLTILPTYQGDIEQTIDLLGWIRELGGLDTSLLVIADSSVSARRSELMSAAKLAYGRAELDLVTVPESGWPAGPNAMFRIAAAAAARRGTPWYFMEPDNTPMRESWFAELMTEYLRSPHPFMGSVHPSYVINHVNQERIQVGRHMMGSGIYPANLSRFTRRHLRTVDAFDIAIGEDIVPFTQHTDLIQHNWRTVEYTETECQPLPTEHGGPRPLPISPKAAIVHGCKDSSLLHLLRRLRHPAEAVA